MRRTAQGQGHTGTDLASRPTDVSSARGAPGRGVERVRTWIGALALVAGHAVAGGSGVSAQDRVVQIEYTPTERAQIAVWVERSDGTFLRTLGLTQSVAYRGIGNRPGASQMNSGFRWPYGRREGVLPVWAHRRAAAPGAAQFRRVIFQDRTSEGHASRSSSDFSRDEYFCLSFQASTTTRDALDAVTCASQYNSDKGRFVTEQDVDAGYFEPAEVTPGVTMPRVLDFDSLYPARRDVTRCTQPGCYDHPDVDAYNDDARRVMPEIDAVTMATPPGDRLQRLMMTWPSDWEDGDYALWIEVNTEGDYNEHADPTTFPTPRNPEPGTPGYDEYWDYWAMNYGYPYRGQPSVVYSVPFHVGAGTQRVTSESPSGYGSTSGWDERAADMRTMDGTITDDPVAAQGSGADRLRRQEDSWRVRVTVVGPEVCEENTPPSAITALQVAPFGERHDAHRYAHLSFVAPADDLGVSRYEVRVATEPVVDEASFQRALPANAAVTDSVALEVPTSTPAGELVEVDLGGLQPLTHFWIAVRAVDGCNASSAIATAEYTTPDIQFTTVSPCFVATAAYGSPLTDEIGALRRFRDRHLRTNAVGRALVGAYQTVGPMLAEWIRPSEAARASVRAVLAPVVRLVRWIDG